jgi:murein DD-endopeptidase MepM/ murein hydrolase activator NlpD
MAWPSPRATGRSAIVLLAAALLLPGMSCTPLEPTHRESPTAGGTGVTHTVEKGETLWRISQLYNVPVAVITEVNHLTGQTIRAGERLFIPFGSLAAGTVGYAGRTTSQILFPGVSSRAFLRPVEGRVVTRFGDIRGDVMTKGIEILTTENAPVIASKEGTVSFESDSVKGYGRMIIIDHAGGYQTVYAFNSNNLVAKGERVRAGARIASAGTSGRTKDPMLHFEIRRNHEPVDPESLLRT